MEPVEGSRGWRSRKVVLFQKGNTKEIPVAGCIRAAMQPGMGDVGMLLSASPLSSSLGLRRGLGTSPPLPSTNHLGRTCADASLSFPFAAPVRDGGLGLV